MSDVLPRPRQNNKSANNYEKCSLSCRFNSTASTNTYCYRDTHTALTGDDYSSFRHISSLESAQYSSISPFHAKYSNQYSYFSLISQLVLSPIAFGIWQFLSPWIYKKLPQTLKMSDVWCMYICTRWCPLPLVPDIDSS